MILAHNNILLEKLKIILNYITNKFIENGNQFRFARKIYYNTEI
jgi:hypothetical protein